MVKLEFESIEEFVEFTSLIGVNPQGNYEKKFVEFDNKISQIWEMLLTLQHKLPQEKPAKKVEPVAPAENLIMEYPPSARHIPKIKKLYNNGYFQLSNNRTSPYHINDLLKIKKLIYSKDCEWDEVYKTIKHIGITTVQRITYALEHGYYNKYFQEWQELQAKEFENRQQKTPIINNPQKRREQGMI